MNKPEACQEKPEQPEDKRKKRSKAEVDNTEIFNKAGAIATQNHQLVIDISSRCLMCQVFPELQAAGIPLPPEGYPAAQRASYTVKASEAAQRGSIGVLWKVGQAQQV